MKYFLLLEGGYDGTELIELEAATYDEALYHTQSYLLSTIGAIEELSAWEPEDFDGYSVQPAFDTYTILAVEDMKSFNITDWLEPLKQKVVNLRSAKIEDTDLAEYERLRIKLGKKD